MLSVMQRMRPGAQGAILVKIPLLMCFGLLTSGISSFAVELMLPQVYERQVDVSGWLMSEKLDGVRGYWDGQQLISKNGHVFFPPAAFVCDLPPFPVEGELWGGRSNYEKTASTVMRKQPHEGWLQLKFAIFDVPQAPGGFTARLAKAKDWFAARPSPFAFVIPQIPVRDHAQLQQELRRIETLGGEGLIVRIPDAVYVSGRRPEILKVKSSQDAEATVVGHFPGKGRNEGRLGSLLVMLADGTTFKLGTGFTDAERQSPPPIDAVVTFRFYGKYQSGLPKFPSFMRIRRDGE